MCVSIVYARKHRIINMIINIDTDINIDMYHSVSFLEIDRKFELHDGVRQQPMTGEYEPHLGQIELIS